MEDIQIDKAIAAAGKEAQNLMDKFFQNMTGLKSETPTAKAFPGGIGYIKIGVKVNANIGLDFVVADIGYKTSGIADLEPIDIVAD